MPNRGGNADDPIYLGHEPWLKLESTAARLQVGIGNRLPGFWERNPPTHMAGKDDVIVTPSLCARKEPTFRVAGALYCTYETPSAGTSTTCAFIVFLPTSMEHQHLLINKPT